MSNIIIGLIVLVVGVALGWFISHIKAQADTKAAGGIIESARKEAEDTLRDARVKAQDEAFKAREQFDKETRDRRQELIEMERLAAMVPVLRYKLALLMRVGEMH